MREIKFRARQIDIAGQALTITGHSHLQQGYVMVKVLNHPFSNKRGYVPMHRLVMEEKLNRFLIPRQELVHHIDGNRANNIEANLKLITPSDHPKVHIGERNHNGQFICQEPIFCEIKIRLLNTNTGQTRPYTLQELIATTFRNGQFIFRGRFTGLKEKNGREIYEGDILQTGEWLYYVAWDTEHACWTCFDDTLLAGPLSEEYEECEVIGNIYENPELLK